MVIEKQKIHFDLFSNIFPHDLRKRLIKKSIFPRARISAWRRAHGVPLIHVLASADSVTACGTRPVRSTTLFPNIGAVSRLWGRTWRRSWSRRGSWSRAHRRRSSLLNSSEYANVGDFEN